MRIRTKVGAKWLRDGGDDELKQDWLGALGVTKILPDFAEQAIRGSIFTGGDTGITTTVGNATTHTGLVLSNTPGSGKLLIPLYFGFAQSVINAAVNAFGLQVGYHQTTAVVHTTPVTPRSTYIGVAAQPSGVGLLDKSATLPTAPTLHTLFGSTPTATTNPNGAEIELKGRIILPPGAYLATWAAAASPASAMHFAFTWLELPIV